MYKYTIYVCNLSVPCLGVNSQIDIHIQNVINLNVEYCTHFYMCLFLVLVPHLHINLSQNLLLQLLLPFLTCIISDYCTAKNVIIYICIFFLSCSVCLLLKQEDHSIAVNSDAYIMCIEKEKRKEKLQKF